MSGQSQILRFVSLGQPSVDRVRLAAGVAVMNAASVVSRLRHGLHSDKAKKAKAEKKSTQGIPNESPI
ncbi:hypothetical protein PENVUL_c047G03143 [Penicillium vulpinum]|uniref:Uncharacterized protein n=1 Tax=Penicillium vulpinum TaxID=29845 RepID=A0A1V6RFX6_9EURO|nr:hypothetical protein PENVUL_c047G03143 [Penicillium vulpinum]